VLFASGIRAILRELEGDDVLATTAFGGALLVMAAGLGAETINMVGALRAHDGQLTPELARAVLKSPTSSATPLLGSAPGSWHWQ
jgi:hypothetical protein